MDKYKILDKLPAYKNRSLLIQKKQSVHDIINEVIQAHEIFKNDYNRIAIDFFQGNAEDTAKGLWNFLKQNVRYKIEGEEYQTTKSPSAILAQGYGDCKHYAGFIGGTLDAIQRTLGKKINWFYRFASYQDGSRLPEHVFVVLKSQGNEIWIDPVLSSFNEKMQPRYFVDKKIKTDMALMRLSGIEDFYEYEQAPNYAVSEILDSTETNSALYNSIQLLLKYGIMNADAQVNDRLLAEYQQKLPAISEELATARQQVQGAAIAGLFGDIWRAVKKIALAAPRNAFLSLVGINAFGYATKLKYALYKPDGSFTAFKDKLKDVWQNKLGGDFSALQNTIDKGATHKAILGAAKINGPEIPLWVATATAIIAAIMPLVNAFLKDNPPPGTIDIVNIDPTTGLPYGQAGNTTGGNFFTDNIFLIIGGAAVIYLLTRKKRA